MSEQVVSAPAAPSGMEAPAQAAAMSPQVPPSQTNAEEAPQRFIQVPADRLNDWGGRFGDALRDAKQFRQAQQEGLFELAQVLSEQGYTAKQIADHLRQQGATAQQAQTGAESVATADPEDQPMTLKQWKAMQAQEREEQRQVQTAASKQENRQREDQAIFGALDSLGYKVPAQGQDDPRFEAGLAIFDRFVAREKAADVPDYPGWNDSLRQHKRQEAMDKAATPAQIERAKARFQAAMKDQANQSVAEFAQGQKQLPPTTLGGGPAGRVPATSLDDLPPDQKRAEVQRRVQARLKGQG